MSREEGENIGLGVGDKNEGGYERRCQPFILRSELITMNCFWHPQDSGGCQVGSWKGRRSDE